MPLAYLTEAFDAQRSYNYVVSEALYSIMLARKEKIIATPKMIEGFEQDYNSPDNVQGALRYNIDPDAPGARPEPLAMPSFPADLINFAQYISNDTQNLTGQKDEAMGMQTNAISGTAIAKRQAASNMAVNIYQDSLGAHLKQVFRVVLDILPKVMDTPNRNIVVRGADEKSKVVTINKSQGLQQNDKTGEWEDHTINDFTKGSFDVEVRVDGSFDAQNLLLSNSW